MAQKHVTVLTDDLDGTEISQGEGETVTFAVDGVTYEIDLTSKNAAKFRDSLAQYIGAARKSGRSPSTTQKARAAANRDYDPKAVRAWANSNKVQVPQRGRIPAEVIDQYRAAGN